jgi:adenylate kinase
MGWTRIAGFEDARSMIVVFIGPPGAGKGTQSRRLVEYLRVPHLSTGDMLRKAKAEKDPVGLLAAGFMDRGQLVPDAIVMEVVGHRLEHPECQNGCLFDGFPRTLGQAASLDEYLRTHHRKISAVIELRAEEEELIARMKRRALTENRVDDTPETIHERMLVYERQTSPLLKYYRERGLLESINAMRSPDEVFQDIQSRIEVRRES